MRRPSQSSLRLTDDSLTALLKARQFRSPDAKLIQRYLEHAYHASREHIRRLLKRRISAPGIMQENTQLKGPA
jgi:hypothetical protein